MRAPRRLGILALLCFLALALAVPTVLPSRAELVLATTTSTEDSGLLDYLLPRFTEETGIYVKVIAVGTGQALALGRRGDADVLLTHAPAAERTFLAEGHAAYRAQVMFNQFVLVGPAADPAGVRGGINISFALQRIADCRCPFLSRGDGSGTHIKELALWRLTGHVPEPSDWYREGGGGMGATLRIADQVRAYTLADDGTFLILSEHLDLTVIVENDPRLLNQYSVMPLSPDAHPDARFAEADRFAQWIVSEKGQAFIASYTVGGRTPFAPNASP